jgi:hypothetical protein
VIRRLLFLSLLVAPAAPLAAQRSSADQLRLAHVLYDQLELEQSARALRLLLSSQWGSPIEPSYRVEATKLLGAIEVLMGRPDSGAVLFRAALQLDPFIDLSPDEYTPAQVGAFVRARRQVFRLGVRPVAEARVDPRVGRVRFTFAATHAATIRAELRRGDSVAVVFETGAEGIGELVWDGLANGRLAPPGRYELRLRGTSRLVQRSDSASAYFDLRAEVGPLEDTLPPPSATDLLPEKTPPSAGIAELGKGLAVAGGVLVIAGPVTGSTLGHDNGTKPAVVAVAGIAAGVVAFIAARRRREIPANIAANESRRRERQAANDAIHARNAERVAATVLIITPAAGVGP